MAHMYKASLEQGMLDMEWPEMDFLITNQKKTKLIEKGKKTFCGEISPTHRTPALSRARQYMISLGMTLEQALQATPSHPAGVEAPGPTAKFASTSHIFEAAEHVEARARHLGSFPKCHDLYYEVARRLVKSGEPVEDPIIAETWKNTKSLSHTQMLTVLQQALVAAEQDTNFNYLALFETCVKLLYEIADWSVTESSFTQSSSQSVTELGSFALWQAAQHEESVSQNRPSQRRILLLRKVALSIATLVKTENSQLCNDSREISSGSIAEHLRPTTLYPAGVPKQYEIVDLGGITFRKLPTTAEEFQHMRDVMTRKATQIADTFKRLNDAEAPDDDTAASLQEKLRKDLQESLFKAGCVSKAIVTVVDKRMVFSARNLTEGEWSEMLKTHTSESITRSLRTGVMYGPGAQHG